jgi:hypothetical protein
MERRARLLLLSITVTFAIVRTWLHLSPDSDFFVAGYNVHHLFTGLLLIAACGIPLALHAASSRILGAAAIGFGAGLALALDEWLYLIVTDGSNAAYVTPISLAGGIILVGAAALYVVVLDRRARSR